MKRGILAGIVLVVSGMFGLEAVADDCLYIGGTPVCIGMKKDAVIRALVKEYDMKSKVEQDGKASQDIWLLRSRSPELGEEMKGIIEFDRGRVKGAYKSWGSFESAEQLFDVVFHLLAEMTKEGDRRPTITVHEIPLKPGADWKQIKIGFPAKEIEIKKVTDRDGSVVILDESLKRRR